MKSRVLWILSVLCCFLLTGCGAGTEKKGTLGDLDAPIVTAHTSTSTQHAAALTDASPAPLSSKQVASSGVLSNGMQYRLYKDGELALSGTPLTVLLKNEPNLSKRVTEIKSLSFGAGVTSVKANSCESMTALTTVFFGKDMQSIGDFAFSGCSALRSIKDWGSTKSIGTYAFNGCSAIENLTLNTVETIGMYAFDKCSGLVSVSIGAQLQEMGANVFNGCSSLNSVIFDGSIPDQALANCASLKTVVTGSNTFSIGEFAFASCRTLTSIELSNTIQTVGKNAFDGCTALMNLSFSDNSIKKIEDNAFRGCTALSAVALSEGLMDIGSNAFQDCTALVDITLPQSLKTVGEYAFYQCSGLKSISLPAGIQQLGQHSFRGCSRLTEIRAKDTAAVFPELVIGDDAFSGCTSLSALDISAKKIENQAFKGCTSLISATVRSSTIGNQAFDECTALTTIDIKSDQIGNRAFSNCTALINTSLNVSTLGVQAFVGCSALPSISINAAHIGNQALENCSGLKSVAFTNAVATYGLNILSGCSLESLTVSAASLPEGCFSKVSVKDIVLENTVQSIGNHAFEDCSTLYRVVLPSSVTSIGDYAFRKCSSLEIIRNENNEDISISSSVSALGRRIFDGCNGIKKLTIHCPEIAAEAFANMPGLESFYLSDDVVSIGKRAFENCVSLTEVDLRETGKVREILDEAFSGCTKIERVRLPAALKKIGLKIFKGCDERLSLIVFGGRFYEWTKVEKDSKQKEWTGLKNRTFNMKNFCKGEKNYRQWK